MKFTYDSAKNDLNLSKHGPPLSDAKLLDWNASYNWVDQRKDYGEERRIALIPNNQRVYCVVYVESKIAIRIISLRKANAREVNFYEEKTN
ncbi:BrnT family toxin [Polynucleobacter sp. JS-JIR-II-50]|uniref:BrnT family toxin n=1 Tax=Polynucleobacter sp. JS-JIR-II-50 TaxID=2576919 RepID=UPI001BFE1AC0|nr:BrnT family toxin [Polynucleobacter sp. JS-JIR-II-50]QWE05143.1 BrnT family toxin [Polynucleobacter sp. JS-JIR-II-50]